MGKIPHQLQNDELSTYLLSKGLTLVSQGKVRNTWRLPNDGMLLVVATDRISIFDFVLNASIPKKGAVLTALTHFWLTKILPKFDHHLVKSARNDKNFNAAWDLRLGIPDLPIERCLVVKDMKEKLYPFEMIYRHHIGGSVFKKYQETGMAGGHKLQPNLPKWSGLDEPIFTPSTKEDVGHDINIDIDYFLFHMEAKGLGLEAREAITTLKIAYSKAYEYAKTKGILILDTKFEVAGEMIVDEILTPDSSRFTTIDDWKKAMAEGRDPYFYDKQLVRDWGAKVETPFGVTGINKLDPENLEHVNFVHSLEIPNEIIQETIRRYRQIFKMITDQELEDYQEKEMGV